MAKRLRSGTTSGPAKKHRQTFAKFSPPKIATSMAGDAVDTNPPLPKLLQAAEHGLKDSVTGDCVVYWMRMGDLRVADNRALSSASIQACKDGIPLVVLFVFSPQDYIAHDRSPRRIDFTLRNLDHIKKSLAQLDIPLHTVTVKIRRHLPDQVINFLASLGCANLFINLEYELDEVRRDLDVCKCAIDKGIKVNLSHDRCIIEPGVLFTNNNKTPAVYGAYHRKWIIELNDNLQTYLEMKEPPHKNSITVRQSSKFGSLFDSEIPEYIEGFRLNEEGKTLMQRTWPAGEDAAAMVLQQFIKAGKTPSLLGTYNPLDSLKDAAPNSTRVAMYGDYRDKVDENTTSRLSPYLSAGVISVRECVRATMRSRNVKKVDSSKDTGQGRWTQELAWRDFYTNVLASWPRVSMGRPWLEKYADVVWEAAQEPGEDGMMRDSKELKAWKEGMTGYPIVDAAMRCLGRMGWVHNRLRMITAMFLTKQLMIDWRIGEQHYMENLIDGDLASNNGGWQWCASTGVDPCPYFRIFNPYSQSEKADPKGNFIRHFVPELASLKGKHIHNPSKESADILGYPRPIVDYKESRVRCLRRLKNVGSE